MDENIGYPRLSRRIQALLIDGVIVPIFALSVLLLAPRVGLVGIYAAISAGLVVFMLEPFLVSVTGGTLGHHLMGVRVASKRSGNNINIFAAAVRFLAKAVFGWFSLITIFTTKRYQGIHDALVGSVVVLKHPDKMPAYEVLAERQLDQGHVYPSILRRLSMMVVYISLVIILIGIALALLVSERCIISHQCSNIDETIYAGTSFLSIVGIIASIMLCWRGRLFGCRRRLKSTDDIDCNEQRV